MSLCIFHEPSSTTCEYDGKIHVEISKSFNAGGPIDMERYAKKFSSLEYVFSEVYDAMLGSSVIKTELNVAKMSAEVSNKVTSFRKHNICDADEFRSSFLNLIELIEDGREHDRFGGLWPVRSSLFNVGLCSDDNSFFFFQMCEIGGFREFVLWLSKLFLSAFERFSKNSKLKANARGKAKSIRHECKFPTKSGGAYFSIFKSTTAVHSLLCVSDDSNVPADWLQRFKQILKRESC